MKTGIDLIKNLYTQVIRHNLTQPEEIDQILMKMAADDLVQNTPVENGLKLVHTARNAEHGSFPTLAGFSYGVAHRKSAQRLPDHYLFFASRAY
jgi:hypothetical protein